MAKADLPDTINEVYTITEDALRSLEWRGLIEDPCKKRIAGYVMAVMLLLPVNFSAKGDERFRAEALTWEYTKRSTKDGKMDREFRVKVREISEAVLNDLVPLLSDLAAKMAGQEQMDDTELQSRLKQLGHYQGEIDGKVGPQTIKAIREFQQAYKLRVTGYKDPETIQTLKKYTS